MYGSAKLTDERATLCTHRHRLANLMADLSTFEGCITHPAGSQQRAKYRAPRADDSSPEIEVCIDRESDSRAESVDQAGAGQSSPASSPAASSPHASSVPEDQIPTQAEGDARCPESFGPMARSDNQQRESGFGNDTSGETMQAADKGHIHSTAAAASRAVPSLAAACARPVSQQVGSQGQKLDPCGEACQQTVAKSTKSEHQPTSSVQQSYAILPQSADTTPKTNTTALFNDSGNGAAQGSGSNKPCAPAEVIDLTND